VGGEGRHENVTLLVVGKGDSWNELRQIAKTSGSEGRIKMVDFRPYTEMPSYLAAADICLLPAEDVATMRNIVPIKMYEYLASEKPVIATRLPGLVKEFGEGNGVVYIDRPEQVIPKAIELARQGSIPQLGPRGRAFVSGNEWEKITDTFESDLKSLIRIRET
jgi:glycosyltransferase involved in cell wall biosynthesis